MNGSETAVGRIQQLVGQQRDQLLRDAERRKLHVTITHRGDAGWSIFKGCFKSDSSTAQSPTLCICDIQKKPEEWPTENDVVGIAFRVGHKKCMFGAQFRRVESVSGNHLLSLSWPETIQQLQRRAYERVSPPPGVVVSVRFRPENSSKEDSGRPVMRHGQLENLSAGGVQVSVSNRTEVDHDSTYQVVFAPKSGSPSLVLETILKHCEEVENDRLLLGFQFIGLETTPNGHDLLERLAHAVASFKRMNQRDESPAQSKSRKSPIRSA